MWSRAVVCKEVQPQWYGFLSIQKEGGLGGMNGEEGEMQSDAQTHPQDTE